MNVQFCWDNCPALEFFLIRFAQHGEWKESVRKISSNKYDTAITMLNSARSTVYFYILFISFLSLFLPSFLPSSVILGRSGRGEESLKPQRDGEPMVSR